VAETSLPSVVTHRPGRHEVTTRSVWSRAPVPAPSAATGLAAASSAKRRNRNGDADLLHLPDTSKATSTAISNCDKAKRRPSNESLSAAAAGRGRPAAAVVQQDGAPTPRDDIRSRRHRESSATAGWIEQWTARTSPGRGGHARARHETPRPEKGKLARSPNNSNTS